MKASGTVGAWIRWGIFGAIAIWTIILFVLSKDVLRVDINNSGGDDRRSELVKELSNTKKLLSNLELEKAALQKKVDEQGYLLLNNQGNKNINGKFDSPLQRIQDKLKGGGGAKDGELYSLEHEVAKRSLDNNIKEIYFYVNKFIEHQNSSTETSKFGKRALEQLLTLLAESTNFSESVDDAGKWHKKSLDSLTSKIQARIHALQNPSDCSAQKLLLCDLNKGCGFGCQLHHVAYCFVVAAAANRTLVLENDGTTWRYSANGWDSVFLPVGKCQTANSAITSSAPWNGIDQAERVVRLPIVDGLTNRPPQLPLSFPKQISDEILRHHTNPPAYFISQFIWYLMRNNEAMEKAIKEAEEKVPFGNEAIVGLQIRRTDKIGTEASFHSVEEYMKWTEHWFRIQELRNDTKVPRKVFIATDDPTVFKEIREKYPDYQVYGDAKNAQTAQMNSRYTDSSLYGVIIDIQLLSRCDYLVCTFSSQVCRMGFELMQVRRGDAGHLFHSLDDIYYYGGQHSHEEVAELSHQPQGDDEFEFKKGDQIGIAGNHWDGFSKGVNRRTGQSGLYPSYKTKESWRIVDFPLFNDL